MPGASSGCTTIGDDDFITIHTTDRLLQIVLAVTLPAGISLLTILSIVHCVRWLVHYLTNCTPTSVAQRQSVGLGIETSRV